MPLICKNCNCTKMNFKKNGPHIGAYCDECGIWVKWCSNKDVEEYNEPITEELIKTELLPDLMEYREFKEPSPYDGDDDDGCMPWEE